jgi:hypothetical protein
MTGPLPAHPLDLAKILDCLIQHGVDFVIVGGIAGVAHGSAYPTYDLDIAYARDDANLQRLAAVLRELEVTLTHAPEDLPFQVGATTLRNGANFTFDTRFGRFDILGHVAGLKSYGDLRGDSVEVEIEGRRVHVASIDHLIAMKRAANRTKDQLMLEEYIVLADEQRRSDESAAD